MKLCDQGDMQCLTICELINATCISVSWGDDTRLLFTLTGLTFDVACYGPDYKPHQDVVDIFDAVVHAFEQSSTYDVLASWVTPTRIV